MIPFIIILIASFILQSIFPWWTLCFGAAAVGYFMSRKIWHAFLQGFLAVFLLWALYAYFLSESNGHLLAERVALIFGITNFYLLILFTGLIGGIAGGFSALTGVLWRKGLASKE